MPSLLLLLKSAEFLPSAVFTSQSAFRNEHHPALYSQERTSLCPSLNNTLATFSEKNPISPALDLFAEESNIYIYIFLNECFFPG